ncbi:MAG: hypothetical protein ACYSTS_17685 [Planctomycetota bacterium]|jgi:hypothetical protein
MDKIFKIGLLVLGFLYLAYLYCPVTNQIGRYRYHKSSGAIYILDTKNADLYLMGTSDKKWGSMKFNPRTGKRSIIRKVDVLPEPEETK